MNILLTGASGQLGHELARSLQALGEVNAPARAEMDLGDLDQLRKVVRALRPDLIVNAAAWTAVDLAEAEPAKALRVNGDAPALLAAEARRLGAPIVHYSTDYVFEGRKAGAYLETDAPTPLNAYGRSKLAGEQALAASGARHLVLRTSWVYGMYGKNFLTTMLARARQGTALRVVADQRGAPTWTRTIAATTGVLLEQAMTGGAPWWERHGGLYHLSCQGDTTWHGFAEAIMEIAGLDCAVQPIGTDEYPAPARRPVNSVLCSHKLMAVAGPLPDWKTALKMCLE